MPFEKEHHRLHCFYQYLFVNVFEILRRSRCAKGYTGNPFKRGEKCVKIPGETKISSASFIARFNRHCMFKYGDVEQQMPHCVKVFSLKPFVGFLSSLVSK